MNGYHLTMTLVIRFMSLKAQFGSDIKELNNYLLRLEIIIIFLKICRQSGDAKRFSLPGSSPIHLTSCDNCNF